MKDKLKADYVTKGVTFNKADPDQEKYLKHALSRPNFSGYVKRLIQRDYETEQKEKAPAYRSAGGGIKIDLT